MYWRKCLFDMVFPQLYQVTMVRSSSLMYSRVYGDHGNRSPSSYPSLTSSIWGGRRHNRSLVKRMKIVHVEGENWKGAILVYVAAYRATPQTITGKSPAEVLFWEANPWDARQCNGLWVTRSWYKKERASCTQIWDAMRCQEIVSWSKVGHSIHNGALRSSCSQGKSGDCRISTRSEIWPKYISCEEIQFTWWTSRRYGRGTTGGDMFISQSLRNSATYPGA